MTIETSKTEGALVALVAVLAAKAEEGAFPAPLRNEALPSRLVDAKDAQVYVNVWDGDNEILSEALGSDDLLDGFELSHQAEIEWIVVGADAAARDLTFDLGIKAMNAAIAADRTLGGAVSDCRLIRVESAQKRLSEEGIADAKGASVIVQMTFLSSTIR